MDRNQNPNLPVETLRDGRLKATVWENHNEQGEPYHTVTLSRTYEDKKGHLQDSPSFSGADLLRIAELAREAHTFVRGARREYNQELSAAERSERAAMARGQGRDQRPARFQDRGGPGPQR